MQLTHTLLRNLHFADGSICDLLYELRSEDDGKTVSRILDIAPYLRTGGLDVLTVIDASDLCILPPFTDLHCHVQDTDREALQSARLSAASGGFGCAVAVCDADADFDFDESLHHLTALGQDGDLCRFYGTVLPPDGGLQEMVRSLCDAKAAGAIAVCDHGAQNRPSDCTFALMQALSEVDLPYFADAQDSAFARGGVNSKKLAQKYALPYSPSVAEHLRISHLLTLAKETNCRLHLQTVTTKAGVDMIRRAKEEGVRVTAETAPQYFCMSQDDLRFYGESARFDPPLRSTQDKKAVLEATLDGTIDTIVSDHRPFPKKETAHTCASQETAFALSYTALVRAGRLSLQELLYRFTDAPCKIASIPPPPPIAVGQKATFNLFCFHETVLQPQHFRAGCANSPFLGQPLSFLVGAMVKNGGIAALLPDVLLRRTS